MKAMSPALKAHYAGQTRTIARCWRMERPDGHVLTVTNIDSDVEYLGLVYEARPGVTPAATDNQLGAAVSNSEISGAMGPNSLEERDLYAGLWDKTFVSIIEVNYRDLSMGHLLIGVGTIGNVQAGRIAFNAELRGLAQALQQTVGDVYTKGCTARFGDSKCKVNVMPLTVAGAITAVNTRREFTDSARVEPSDYFGAGLFRFTSGECAGYAMEIAEFLPGGVIKLVLPMPQNVAVGDAYEMIPGCRKRFQEDCKTKWTNVLNFRGFPYVPGGDIVLGLGGTEGTNL